ncbi:MAG: fibrobacter succinogenes major paralogous domain-containing protein [Dysgonamonadaceae bacterium]|jgi:uncharacterized protein (TIGR02145 family)|nr:fibrobacter succinogenes major paralogous domain-containing protein [Dysgonamonadaceae bacterium]
MKTKHFLVLSLILATAIFTLQAQVRIGELSAPRSGISLDLNIRGDTARTALGLPRVKLIDTTNPQPIANNFAALNGAVVYNYSAENGMDVGIYFAGANSWVKLLAGSDATSDKDIDLLDPLPATVWLGGATLQPRQLTVTTTIDDDPESSLSYRWYYLGTDGTPVATDSTARTFSISNGSATHQLTSAGEVKKYFCVVRNGSKSVVTTRVRAVYGTGVFLNNDRWLTVLNYNLGVSSINQNRTPTAQFLETAYTENVVGYLFQWGRAADGHQLRDNPNPFYTGVESSVNGIATSNLNVGNGQVVNSHSAYGKFITRNDVTNSKSDWRQYPETSVNSIDAPAAAWIHDPCSSLTDGGKTWRLPTSSEWVQICANNNVENTGKGLRFKPDGTDASIFLPASGVRSRSGGILYDMGSYGHYWSSTSSDANVFTLNFGTTVITPARSVNRAHGMAVRCVSE